MLQLFSLILKKKLDLYKNIVTIIVLKCYNKKMNERQKLILEFAKEKIEFQTKDVLEFFEWKFDVERMTVIRDLNFLVKNNLLSQKWKWRAVKYFFSVKNKIFEEINLDDYFSVNYEKRKIFKTFNFELFNTLKKVDIFSKEEIEKLENLQKDFIKNIWKYDSQTLINKEYERIMIEFSWKSSAIEWNTYWLLATEALLKENIGDNTKTKEETQMILNHKDAFNETLLNLDTFKELKLSDVEYIHQVLTKKLWITSNIRKNIVWITWTEYKPLDNEFQIKEALEKMVELVNFKENFFEKSFLLLLIISYIQGFEDWNKRTARMMSNAILLSNNSIPLSYRWVDVVEYKKATILFYEKNNINYFKKIFIDQFEDSVKNYFN